MYSLNVYLHLIKNLFWHFYFQFYSKRSSCKLTWSVLTCMPFNNSIILVYIYMFVYLYVINYNILWSTYYFKLNGNNKSGHFKKSLELITIACISTYWNSGVKIRSCLCCTGITTSSFLRILISWHWSRTYFNTNTQFISVTSYTFTTTISAHSTTLTARHHGST